MSIFGRKNSNDREVLKDIFFQSLKLADPVKKIKELDFESPTGKVFFVAVGKGAGRNAKAFRKKFCSAHSGIVIIPENEYCEELGYRVFKATHPIPSKAGLEASDHLIKEVSKLGKDDLLVFCISGGASALLPFPPIGFDLEDEIYLNEVLLASGLSIKDMNKYRGAFSRLKAGRLAQVAYPCPIINLVVSDIPGDDLSLVGSGPTFVDNAITLKPEFINFGRKLNKFFSTSFQQQDLEQKKSVNVKQTVCLSSSKLLFDSARSYIQSSYGLDCRLISSDLEGDVVSLVQLHKRIINEIYYSNGSIKKPAIILSGGEVEISLPAKYGSGGRNSHFALILSKEIAGMDGITALIADTDGVDGANKNAGAIIDGETFCRLKSNYPDNDPISLFDSYNMHKKVGALFFSGPTGINLNDFRAILLR